MKGDNIEDPIMKEFVDNADRVNHLAESSEGFIWRFEDENGNPDNVNPFKDGKTLVNLSVWDGFGSMEKFVYQTFHSEFIKRKSEWFHKIDESHLVLWWIEKDQFPTVKEAVNRLSYLQKNGTSDYAFDFRNKFPFPQ